MPLSFDDFQRKSLGLTSEESEMSSDELDALQFLSVPNATVEELSDETLEKYIQAVGGIENWIELRTVAEPEEAGRHAKQRALTIETVNPADQSEESSVFSSADAPKPGTSRWQRAISYVKVGMAASAATLLLVTTLWHERVSPGEGAGWTGASVEVARQVSIAAGENNFDDAKKSSYSELSRSLEELEALYFGDTPRLREGLKELAVSCHELRVRVDDFNLNAKDKSWLRNECNAWAALAIEKLSSLESTNDANSRSILARTKEQLSDMRRQLEGGGTPG